MISFVIPAREEEENLPILYKELKAEIPKLDSRYEIIFVDDGSSDSTLSVMKKLRSKDRNIKIYSLRRSHGKAEVLTFAFQKAKGNLIVTLDADLQDRPSEIKKLLKKRKEGFDMVAGWRKNRKDTLSKRIFSKFFNFVVSVLWDFKFNDMNGGLKVYTSEAAKSLNLYGGMQRFIPVILASEGFVVTEVPIIHFDRKFGKSKYSGLKFFKEMPDMLSMIFLNKYSKKPLHFFGFIGGLVFLIGLIILFYLSIIHFQGQSIGRRPLLFLGMLLVLGGFQILFTGFLADLIIHLTSNGKNGSSIYLKYTSEKL